VTRAPVWLERSAAVAAHEWLMAEHGAAESRYDTARLEAALAGPRELHREGTTDVFRLAARYALGTARDRPFGANSTRVALTLAGVFLALNGWRVEGTEADAASVTRALASGELDASAYAMWLEGASRRIPSRPA
jgi:prophage maintenance system killer protein